MLHWLFSYYMKICLKGSNCRDKGFIWLKVLGSQSIMTGRRETQDFLHCTCILQVENKSQRELMCKNSRSTPSDSVPPEAPPLKDSTAFPKGTFSWRTKFKYTTHWKQVHFQDITHTYTYLHNFLFNWNLDIIYITWENVLKIMDFKPFFVYMKMNAMSSFLKCLHKWP